MYVRPPSRVPTHNCAPPPDLQLAANQHPLTKHRPKQKNPNLTQIICKPQLYREARRDFTQQNADYLRKITNGGVGAYLGPFTNGNNCQRMACEYASGLYVCNDNLFAINVPWTTLADYAEAVMNDPRQECNYHIDHYEGGHKGQDVTWGQAFDANGWLVLDLSFSPP